VVLALAPTLEDLSLHDNELRELPALDCCSRLQHLRLDRNPLTALVALPIGLLVLHLEGCPLPGTLEAPGSLPPAVRALAPAKQLLELQLPSGDFMGIAMGWALHEALGK
jgi:Leucine-rich repeat (LRR) protein